MKQEELANGPRTPRDQFEVFWILRYHCTRRPMHPSLAVLIMDIAEYWLRVEAKRSDSVTVDAKQSPNGMFYVMTEPLPGRVNAPVQAFTFATLSHDQGWSSFPHFHGSYDGSWTWFDVVIEGKDGVTAHLEGDEACLCRNVHASLNPKEHRVTFGQGPGRRSREWTKKIHRGSRVGILAQARFPG